MHELKFVFFVGFFPKLAFKDGNGEQIHITVYTKAKCVLTISAQLDLASVECWLLTDTVVNFCF